MLLSTLCWAGSPSRAEAPQELVEAVMEVALAADEHAETMVVLRGAGGKIYVQEEDFAKLRLHRPATAPLEHEGHLYYAPADIHGCIIKIDEIQQRVEIDAPASAFDTTRLSVTEQRHPGVTPASPGAFLNYQISAQQVSGQTTGAVFGEFGAFAGVGVLTNTMVARSETDSRELVRLDTTYTRNYPDTLQTLSLGDAISDPGTWGAAERYAGVRWSSNFALRPDLLTMPLMSTTGTAAVPSTVDVFVNNQLVNSSQVPAGPFVIDKLPMVTGTGDVSLVVRDATGRQQVITQTLYSSVTLLAPGLSQYSLDVGSVRENYAMQSDHYGGVLGEASYRRGINDWFTLEEHGEYLAGDAHAAGMNAAFGLGHFGVLNVTVADGGNSAGTGLLSGIGIEHRGGIASFVASTQWASGGFAQVGQAVDPDMRPRQRTLLQTGTNFGRFGSLALALVHQTYQASPSQDTISLTDGITFGRAGTLSLTLTRTRNSEGLATTAASGSIPASTSIIPAQQSISAYLIFAHSIGERGALTTSLVNGHGVGAPEDELVETYTQSPPVGPGNGYRLSASTAGNYDADWRRQGNALDLELEVARNQGVSGQNASLSGAMTLLDGEVNATRSVNGSFAMVDVAGLADVPVYVENQLTAHTDSSGRVLLYNLRPYEANHISIEPTELPLDTTIDATSTIVAPPYRSGVIARFPIERSRGATLRLVTEDGNPLPVGAIVTLKGAQFPVVLDGAVYVTGYDHGMAGEATWKSGHCRFRLDPPPSDDPLPNLGTIRCVPSLIGSRPAATRPTAVRAMQ